MDAMMAQTVELLGKNYGYPSNNFAQQLLQDLENVDELVDRLVLWNKERPPQPLQEIAMMFFSKWFIGFASARRPTPTPATDDATQTTRAALQDI